MNQISPKKREAYLNVTLTCTNTSNNFVAICNWNVSVMKMAHHQTRCDLYRLVYTSCGKLVELEVIQKWYSCSTCMHLHCSVKVYVDLFYAFTMHLSNRYSYHV